ncbi:flagellar brake protein [Gilvimarinus polysaccharolyticus]|uniref:flagellar brake protein n=1 Tax=Gilvimarinus polysaccharolyticus TaxID=863921 RepID=UPI000673501B|nr:flagellar brake protein [Gilvimarinus polysaccharolyticus]
MDFADLKLPYGTSLQLQATSSSGQPEKFASRLVGAVPGRSLIFSVPRAANKAVRFRPGQKLAVRLMVANGVGLFAAVVEAQSAEPYPLLYVSYPETVTFKGIRGATRVTVGLPVITTNRDDLSGIKSEGCIADISTSGARLELRDAIVSVGDNLTIDAEVKIAELTRHLSVTAVVRARIERSTKERDQDLPAVYGVEFIERNQDALLVLYAYVFAQILKEQMPHEIS